MELEWNFKTNQELSDISESRNLTEIQNDIKNIVKGFYKDDKLSYYKLALVSKYQEIFEIVSFLFEDHRKDFETQIRKRVSEELEDEQLQVEVIVFCSWISLEIMTALSISTQHNREKTQSIII